MTAVPVRQEIQSQARQGFLSLILWCVVVVVVFYCVGPDEIFAKKMVKPVCTKHDVHVLLHVHVITSD